MKKELKKREEVATLAAMRAGRIQRKFYEGPLDVMRKGEVDLLTQVDLRSQEVILKTLRKAFPQDAFLAEENQEGHHASLKGPIWVIDPLDGTTNYAHGFPFFAVSIAFREHGTTQFGLIYQPLLRELFIAHRGRGATRNGKPIHVSRSPKVAESLLATGFPYDRRISPRNNLDLFHHFELAALCVRRAGAAALDLAYVAAGRLDGFWEPKLSAWDVAAGILMVQEAGGRVTDYRGKLVRDLWGGEVVASNGRIHREMVKATLNAA